MATTTGAPELPTAKQMQRVMDALGEMTDTVAQPEGLTALAERVFQAINYEGEQIVPFARIGRLLYWSHTCRDHLTGLVDLLDRMDEATLRFLAPIAECDGRLVHSPEFDEHGRRGYDHLKQNEYGSTAEEMANDEDEGEDEDGPR